MFCTQCGTALPDSARFCPSCGHPAGQVPAAAAGAVTAEGLHFERIAEMVLRSSADYARLHAHVRKAIVSMGGKIKSDDPRTAVIDARWRYGINLFGLRVTASFYQVSPSTVEIRFAGGFVDAFDTTSAGLKKALEVIALVTGEHRPH